jgi:hypothetical protein
MIASLTSWRQVTSKWPWRVPTRDEEIRLVSLVLSTAWPFASGLFYMLHYDALDDGVCETADFIYTLTVHSTKNRLSIELILLTSYLLIYLLTTP